jgi:hypothetical protein
VNHRQLGVSGRNGLPGVITVQSPVALPDPRPGSAAGFSRVSPLYTEYPISPLSVVSITGARTGKITL